ncbi:hypothetical protein [Spirillospora sp. CA-294931]|uniref:hypothetical protein n=1 Tax=Spirillospora sp. CA-294931 TaxID=3240042 RepID=UPI003D94CB74
MTVHQRRLRVSAVVLGLALFTTACGGDSGGGGEAASTGKAGTSTDQQLKLAKCMREHGVDMADPKSGEDSAGVTIGDEGTSPQKIEKAIRACRTVAGIPEPKPISQAERDRMLKFARCMRARGVDMPDPKFEGGAVEALPLPSSGPQKEKFDKAGKACGGQFGTTGR